MTYMGLMIISVVFALVGGLLSRRLKSKFDKYAKMPINTGQSGREIAEQMLRDNNIHDVQIVEGRGHLTDHYNPQTKIVSLSPAVYNGRSIAAAAVASHECGHAVQHAEAYGMLEMRSALVPIVNISARLQQYFFMFAFVMIGALNNSFFLLLAIAAFAITTLFSLVTLPVEFDASRRALVWLNNNVSKGREYEGAKDALWWAAMTYVSAALAAVTQLLYLVFIFLGNRD